MEALGFEENFLPSFALPPADLTDLRIVYGSCRRPANSHLDAMAQIDDLMRDNADYDFKDPLKRPHQLHLGGDQIYADDVSPVHLYHLIDLGRELIGARTGSGETIETLRVTQIRGKKVDDAERLRRLRRRATRPVRCRPTTSISRPGGAFSSRRSTRR